MRHPTEGVLRRLVDEPAGVADADRAHVADCPACLRGLAAARDDAAARRRRAARRPVAVDVDAAWARLSATAAAARRRPSGRPRAAPAAGGRRCAVRWSPRSAPSSWSPAPASPPPTTGCRSSAPSGRPGRGQPRPTWSRCPTCPPTATSRSSQRARPAAGAPTRRPREERTGLDVPEVAELPAGVTGDPAYQVGRRRQRRRSPSPPRRPRRPRPPTGEALPPAAGRARRQPAPAGRRPGRRRRLVAADRACRPSSSPAPSRRRRLVRRPVRDGARLPAVPARAARRARRPAARPLRRRRDAAAAGARRAGDQLHGRRRRAPATVLTSRDGTFAGVVWVEDGVVTAVAGSLSADEVLSVARGLR